MIRQMPVRRPEHYDLAGKLSDRLRRFHCNNVGKPLFCDVRARDSFKMAELSIEPSALILRSRASGVSKDGSERAGASFETRTLSAPQDEG
jgi:hypothetical protein